MIINSTPEDKAVFGGITKVSEFKIKNSAKAFGILSSGLYANKIRAIIRELSCNAVDSHVAAKKSDIQFDLHLPTRLQPYFSIRDYGVGLNLDDVTHIYTTYFESTKADSNDFIGALGLGSKSPFSYTDSFTVIAIKDGVKGIFSAFINDDGVPSVAEMGVEKTDEPAGVEVKFAVTDYDDFWRFSTEARSVFTYFDLMPKLTGAEIEFKTVEYASERVVDGVQERISNGGRSGSTNFAIMGNIAYPIEIPGADRKLGDLNFVDNTGLDIRFALGEIEFQASREGLQYTESTISAIKARYKTIADALEVTLTAEADEIENMWERVQFLSKRSSSALWSGVVRYYIKNNKVPFLDGANRHYHHNASIELDVKALVKDYNIELRCFTTDSGWSNAHDGKTATERKSGYRGAWDLSCNKDVLFIKNTANARMWERSKYHTKTAYKKNKTAFVISAADVDKPVDVVGFLAAIHGPPESQVIDVSDLTFPTKTERSAAKITLLKLKIEPYNRDSITWKECTTSPGDMDASKKYCYVPIVGFKGSSKSGKDIDVKQVYQIMRQSGHSKLCDIQMYGVRKDDVAAVEALSNWIRYDDLVEEVLGELKTNDFLGMVLSWVDSDRECLYYNKTFVKLLDEKSPMRVFCKKLPKEPVTGNRSLFELSNTIESAVNLAQLEETATMEIDNIRGRYAMIQQMQRGRYLDEPIVAEYINLVDQHKGLT
jgi:hypothetical protein